MATFFKLYNNQVNITKIYIYMCLFIYTILMDPILMDPPM